MAPQGEKREHKEDDLLDRPVNPSRDALLMDEDEELKVRLSVLFQYIRMGDVDCTRKVLTRSPKLVSFAAPHGMYAIHYVIKRGNTDILCLLLDEFEADVNMRDGEREFSCLMWACKRGNLSIAQILIDKGADVLACDEMDGTFPLHWGAFSGNVEIIRLLLSSGADVATTDNYGYTALHWAARRGMREAVFFLIANGSDIEERTTSGATALHCACWEGHVELALALLDHGADEEATNVEGFTGLQLWSERGGLWGVVSAGLKVSIKDRVLALHKDGDTDLYDDL